MVVKKIYEVNNQSQILVNIPKQFRNKKKVMVIVEDTDEAKLEKLEKMKRAAEDPLFQSDIDEITDDFKFSDEDVK